MRCVTFRCLFSQIVIYHQSILLLMSFWRVLLSILFPPLSVIDKGCGSILIVFLLWICGWIPGVIAALIILNNPNR